MIPEWDTHIIMYLDELAALGRSRETIRTRRSWLRIHAHAVGVPPAEVTRAHVVAWMARNQWQPETRKSARATIVGFYTWAHTQGHIPTNPTAGLPAVTARPGLPRPCDEELLEAAYDSATPRDELMIRLAANAGLRRGEIARLHTSDLDSRGLWVTGKGNRRRFLPLGSDSPIRALMVGLPDGWVFPGRWEGHMNPDAVGKAMRRALGGRSSAHPLRHRFATVVLDETDNLRLVQQLLGHSSPGTTAIYTKVSDRAMSRGMAAAA